MSVEETPAAILGARHSGAWWTTCLRCASLADKPVRAVAGRCVYGQGGLPRPRGLCRRARWLGRRPGLRVGSAQSAAAAGMSRARLPPFVTWRRGDTPRLAAGW